MPKRKCDVERSFTPEELHKHWGNGKPIQYRCKRYKVGKMSYGDYFLEPADDIRGETEGFSPKTVWLEKKAKKNQYGINQIIYEVEK